MIFCLDICKCTDPRDDPRLHVEVCRLCCRRVQVPSSPSSSVLGLDGIVGVEGPKVEIFGDAGGYLYGRMYRNTSDLAD